MDVVSKTASMSPPTSKKETQVFLGAVGFWRMHIPELSQIVSPLYPVMQKMNYFKWGPEQQASDQIKEEIVHAELFGSVRTGQDEKTALHCSWGEWSFLESLSKSTRGHSRMTPGVLELGIQRIQGLLRNNRKRDTGLL